MTITKGNYCGTTEVLLHRVSFRWFVGRKKLTEEHELDLWTEARERAEHCIKEGYQSGELNIENEDLDLRGWWWIGELEESEKGNQEPADLVY